MRIKVAFGGLPMLDYDKARKVVPKIDRSVDTRAETRV